MEKLKEKISDITECSICTETMTDPRVLPCVHSFCLKCLQAYVKEKIEPNNSIDCPLCRKAFTLETGGFEALPINHFINKLIDVNKMCDVGENGKPSPILCDICFGINRDKVAEGYCVECREHLCCACLQRHGIQKSSKSHKTVKLESKPSPEELLKMSVNYCQFHPTQEICLYCNECQVIACVVCYVDIHNEHKCTDIKKSCNEITQRCDKVVLAINDYIAETEIALSQISVTQNVFEQQIQETEKFITNKYEQMKAILASQHHQLMNHLNEKRTKRLKELEMLKEESEHELVMMKSFERYWNELKAKGSACDIVQASDSLSKRAEDLIEKHDQQKKENCNKIKPSYYRVECNVAESTGIKECYLIGQIKEISENELNEFPDWRPLLQDAKIDTMLSGLGCVTGLAIYDQQVFLARNGISNIEVYNCSDLKTLCRRIDVPGLTNCICLIFSNVNNCLYVSNYYKSPYIFKIDVVSNSISGWPIQKGHPYGLSMTRKHNLLVSIYSAGCVEEYKTFGTLVRSIPVGEVKGIIHAVELKSGRFALLESGSPNRVILTDVNGNILQTFHSGSGSTIGQLAQALYMEADVFDNLLIVDYGICRLVILSENLQELGQVKLSDLNSSVVNPRTCIWDGMNRRLLLGTAKGLLLSMYNKDKKQC